MTTVEQQFKIECDLRRQVTLLDTYAELAAELWVVLFPGQPPSGTPEELAGAIRREVERLKAREAA